MGANVHFENGHRHVETRVLKTRACQTLKTVELISRNIALTLTL